MNHLSRASIFRRPDWPIRFEGSAFTPRERYTLFAIKGLGKAMREITLSSLAATKMMLHCYKYPHLRKLENIHFSNLSTRPVFWASKYSVDNFFMNFD